MTINCLAQKIRKFNFRYAKRRVVGNKELQGGGEDEQRRQVAKIRRLRNFAPYEILQVTKFHNLRIFAGCENFHNLKKSQENFDPPYA